MRKKTRKKRASRRIKVEVYFDRGEYELLSETASREGVTVESYATRAIRDCLPKRFVIKYDPEVSKPEQITYRLKVIEPPVATKGVTTRRRS